MGLLKSGVPMSKGNVVEATDARRLLVERIASSPYVKRSARLRDLLLYLSDRVLEEEAGEIHEQEVGHRVFDRPPDYDTAADNIVRVHASTLRKRLQQYFDTEGAQETLILEIPKGNYAPVFRRRNAPTPDPDRRTDWRIWSLAAAAILFAASTAYLVLRGPFVSATSSNSASPTVQLLWSQVFQPERPTDVVLDDAAVGLYQELTGRPLPLSNYYDRSYLRTLPEAAAAAHLDQSAVSSIVTRRQTSFSGANLVWKLSRMPGLATSAAVIRFARDYSFRELKANNAIFLGSTRSNPWMEPFESRLGLRWVYDAATGAYSPVDSWAKNEYRAPDGYCEISLLPNLGHTGNVLIITGTGGSAMNAGMDFLSDEQSVAALRRALPPSKDKSFPAFEALIKVKGRGASPRDASIVVCRPPRG